MTFRPEFIARWIGQPHVTVLALNRLMQHESVMLIERIRDNQALSAELIEDIIERTDGVPLFIEELTKAVLEASGSGEKSSSILSTLSPTALAVPATLHSSLMARIDRLGMSVKEIVQIGAVIGREFTYPLLAALARRGDSELQTALDHLAESGLVFRRGIPPDATYIFKHALVHDSAYASLLRSHRQQLHATLGQIIEERFTSVSETQPEIVAQHYAKGGITAKAVSYWLKAGQFACARSANAEAEAHLLKGMKLLRELPEGLERDRRELELQCAIGPVMIARKGYSAADSLGAYERARELLIETGDVEHRDEVLTGLVLVFANRGAIDAALQVAKEMLRFAEASGNHTSLCIAHRCTGALLSYIGQISRGQHHAARAVEFYDESRDWNVGFRFGHDIGVSAFCQASFAYWLSGLPDSSARMASRALDLARKLKHANSQAYAAAWASLLFAFNRRDVAALERDAMQLIAFAREQGLPQFEAWATCFGALPLIDQGSAEEAVRKVRGGIAACESIQNWLFRPVFGAILARAYAAANRDQDALRAISEALDAAERFGQQWMCPELWRIRGVVLSSSQESEECFRHAIDVARKQESRLLELRAATSLARMWYDQGQCDKACELPAPVYGWFTEGFDTADLMEAKALLNYMDGTVICDEDKAARKQF